MVVHVSDEGLYCGCNECLHGDPRECEMDVASRSLFQVGPGRLWLTPGEQKPTERFICKFGFEHTDPVSCWHVYKQMNRDDVDREDWSDELTDFYGVRARFEVRRIKDPKLKAEVRDLLFQHYVNYVSPPDFHVAVSQRIDRWAAWNHGWELAWLGVKEALLGGLPGRDSPRGVVWALVRIPWWVIKGTVLNVIWVFSVMLGIWGGNRAWR